MAARLAVRPIHRIRLIRLGLDLRWEDQTRQALGMPSKAWTPLILWTVGPLRPSLAG